MHKTLKIGIKISFSEMVAADDGRRLLIICNHILIPLTDLGGAYYFLCFFYLLFLCVYFCFSIVSCDVSQRHFSPITDMMPQPPPSFTATAAVFDVDFFCHNLTPPTTILYTLLKLNQVLSGGAKTIKYNAHLVSFHFTFTFIHSSANSLASIAYPNFRPRRRRWVMMIVRWYIVLTCLNVIV